MSQNKTNWDQYYLKPVKLSKLTRYLTGRLLVSLIRKYVPCRQPLKIMELGGGGSVFYRTFSETFSVDKYVAVDNNLIGLNILSSQKNAQQNLEVIHADILDPEFLSSSKIVSDLVFSVGLIEHFSKEQLVNAIKAHFSCVANDGIVIIAYPTATWLYRISRWVAESFSLWAFPDETPLIKHQVADLVRDYGKILAQPTNWWTPFTQGITIIQRHSK
jgi:hypothetical protein